MREGELISVPCQGCGKLGMVAGKPSFSRQYSVEHEAWIHNECVTLRCPDCGDETRTSRVRLEPAESA
jgi:ribosomal protein S27E